MFVGHFCPPGSGFELRIRIRIQIQGPHWIRIQSGYGSGFTALDAADSWRHSHLPSGVSLMRSSPGAIRRLALIPFPRSAVSNTSATWHSLLWRLQPFFCTQPKHVSALCFFRTLKNLSSYNCGSITVFSGFESAYLCWCRSGSCPSGYKELICLNDTFYLIFFLFYILLMLKIYLVDIDS